MRWIAPLLLLAAALNAQSLAELKRGLSNPPADSRIMMRWWWFGPAVTKADIDRDLNKIKQGGIGGVEIQPVYPLSTEGNYAYLSPQFLEMVKYASERATALGLRVDVTVGSGWPFGGPHVSALQAAGRLRIEKLNGKLPALADGEELITTIANVAYISSRTGQMVKRPGVGAEGFVLDHYDPLAIAHHQKVVGEPLLKAFGDHPPYAVFSDSLEVYASDWTPDFVRQFQQRRGYDIRPHLASLDQELPDSGEIRNDWARTLTELCNENYLVPMNRWAHDHKTQFRTQTYGFPPVTLASQALVDLPEGEKPHWRQFTASRWASSAAHLYGKPVVSTETWTWLHSPSFRATPLDMKAEADLHFLIGINQLIGHGWPTPATSRLYAAAAFSDTNPWYSVMPDVALYLQRMSWLMRQGKPANDVALYLPTADVRARMRPGNASIDHYLEITPEALPIDQILDAGYNLDFIDDETIEKIGISHAVLVLPNVQRMSAAAAAKIRDYKGKVITLGRVPDKAPGLKDEAPKLQLPVATNLTQALHDALPPDVEKPAGVGFIHRKTADADIYFVANTTNQPVSDDIRFRAQGRRTVLDPFTLEPATLTLQPYESRIVIIGAEGDAGPVAVLREDSSITPGFRRHVVAAVVLGCTDLYNEVRAAGGVALRARFRRRRAGGRLAGSQARNACLAGKPGARSGRGDRQREESRLGVEASLPSGHHFPAPGRRERHPVGGSQHLHQQAGVGEPAELQASQPALRHTL